MKRFADQMRRWGPLGVSLFTLFVVLTLAFAYFVARPPVQDALYSGPATLHPAIQQALFDDLAGGDLIPGPSQGAAPNSAYGRPVSWFADQGTKFEWQPSPNWAGRGTNPIEAITVHVTAGGTCDGIVNYFKQSGGVASHFLVCPEKVVQQVEIGDAAFHQGIWGARLNPYANPIIDNWWRNGINPNLRTIGIETLLKPGEQLDNFPTMRENLVDLLVYLVKTLNLPPDRIHIIGHFETDLVNRPSDPTCCMNLDTIVAEVAKRVFQPAPQASEWGTCDTSWRPGGCWNEAIKRWVSAIGLFDPARPELGWDAPPLP